MSTKDPCTHAEVEIRHDGFMKFGLQSKCITITNHPITRIMRSPFLLAPKLGDEMNATLISFFKGEDSALFGGPGSAKRLRMNGPGSLLQSVGGGGGGGGADAADSPSLRLVRSSSPRPASAALSPPPLPVTVAAGDRLFPPGLRSTSMGNNTENNNKVIRIS